MNRKLARILCVIFMTLIVVLISNTVFATSGSELAKKFDGTGGVSTSDGENLIIDVIGPVLSVVRIVAIGISVIMITYLGIQYMSAAPQEKADIKNKLITFTIGAIVVIGATALLDIVKNFANNAIE